ncbi:hypothetical protein J1N35_034979, partial [Gossypium stocksii]
MKFFEHKPFDARAVMGFGILNEISIGLLNLSLGFNSVGFYQDEGKAPYLHVELDSKEVTSKKASLIESYSQLRGKIGATTSISLEFGHIVGTHSSKSVSVVYGFGPFLALYRAAIISFHVLKLTIWQFFFKTLKRASKFRETLICLGPFYVKLGQALSTRPDILSPVYCQELAKLQLQNRFCMDQIPPFPTHVAIKSIENELGIRASEIFADLSPEPIAAASIGQV